MIQLIASGTFSDDANKPENIERNVMNYVHIK
jgi:hypothetical protein